MLNRFVERLDQVAESSNLHDARQQLKSGLANAETVELISTTVFESGHRAMSKQQLADLETSLEESSAIEKYLSNPDATLVVLGYADQVGDESANNLVALYRAENVREALKDSSQIDGAKLEIKSWFVGETDILSEEQGVAEKESNRAAEIWLIVHDGDLFDEIGSDIKSPAAKCNLYTSDNASHRKQISSNGRSRVSSRHLPTRNNGHAPKSSRCEKN
jgi:outer membrane protein OmpA-like peptidoglycan-associated protein